MVANLLVTGKSGHIAAEGIPDHSVTEKYLVKHLYNRRTKNCSYPGCLSISKLGKIPEHTYRLLLIYCSSWSANF